MRALAGMQGEFWEFAADNLIQALASRKLNQLVHVQVVNSLVALAKIAATYEDFALVRRAGMALEENGTHNQTGHTNCCSSNIANLLPPSAVDRIAEIFLDKKNEPVWVRTVADILRWAGAGLLVLSVISVVVTRQPDVLISGDGHNVAVRGRDGRLHLMKTAKDAFLVKEWLSADADGRDATDLSLGDGVSCDGEGCVAPLTDGRFAALSLKPDGLADDCARAAVIVAASAPPPGCQATVIELKRLRTHGAMTLRWTKQGLVTNAVKPRGISRPWSPAAGDAETDRELLAGGASRPVDATPPETERQSED